MIPYSSIFSHKDFRSKNSMPMQVRREFSGHGDSEELLELNPKLKLIQQFPEILHANGDTEGILDTGGLSLLKYKLLTGNI